MPTYCFRCSKCHKSFERFLLVKHSSKPQYCECGYEGVRDFQAEMPNIGDREYRRPIHSDALAVSPEQRKEHQRLFPDIKLDNQNRPVFDNYRRHDEYLKKTGFRKPRMRRKRRFTSKLGG